MHNKMNRFLPPANDWSLESEFECWHPDPKYSLIGDSPSVKSLEAPGMQAYLGADLKFIEADQKLPHVDLPAKLKEMMDHCWKKASHSPAATRGPIQIGGARQQAFNNLRPQIGGARMQANMMKAGTHTPMVSPTNFPAKAPHLEGIASDWSVMKELNRVNAFTFRGDSRTPGAIKTAGGFNPPVTRNDQTYVEGAMYDQFADYMKRRFQVTVDKRTFLEAYNKTFSTPDSKALLRELSLWQHLVHNESLHAGRMVANEALKGYISTTKAITVAKGFAKSNGWVYLTLVQGGFEIPAKGKHAWTQIFGEQEIALPCALEWKNIFGFRQIAPQGPLKFVGPIYMRKGASGMSQGAMNQALDLFSGKPQ